MGGREVKIKYPAKRRDISGLPDMDSNHDILNQNQLYYPYTIGQSVHSYRMGCKNRVGQQLFQIFSASGGFFCLAPSKWISKYPVFNVVEISILS